jgi:uncharacterized alkaline shock family protein YloU
VWRRASLGPAVNARVRDGHVSVRLAVVARPSQPLEALGAEVRAAVCSTVERLLGLELDAVTVVVDGVGS